MITWNFAEGEVGLMTRKKPISNEETAVITVIVNALKLRGGAIDWAEDTAQTIVDALDIAEFSIVRTKRYHPDLAALVATGQGDLPLVQLPLRCSACGKTGHRIIVSGRSYGYSEGR
jgi:hypothetical protein